MLAYDKKRVYTCFHTGYIADGKTNVDTFAHKRHNEDRRGGDTEPEKTKSIIVEYIFTVCSCVIILIIPLCSLCGKTHDLHEWNGNAYCKIHSLT